MNFYSVLAKTYSVSSGKGGKSFIYFYKVVVNIIIEKRKREFIQTAGGGTECTIGGGMECIIGGGRSCTIAVCIIGGGNSSIVSAGILLSSLLSVRAEFN